MKKRKLNQKKISKVFLYHLKLISSFLILLLDSCTYNPNNKGYVAIYNYSAHGDISFGYAEIIIPVPSKSTHSMFNEYDYSFDHYVRGAELITTEGTYALMYEPQNLHNQFFNLSHNSLNSEEYSSYIFLFEDPFKWSSLFKMDSLLRPIIKNINMIKYLDTNGEWQTIKNLTFGKPRFFLDSKIVSEKSSDFFKEMYIERPPK